MIEIVPNLHPIFVHFTVGLITMSMIFFILSSLASKFEISEEFLITGRWCLWSGAAFTIIAIVTGLQAYYSVNHDTPSHVAMTDHRNWAFVTVTIVLLLTVFSVIQYFQNKKPSNRFLIGMLLVLGLLISTAWRGGELVYRYGLGVMSLPQSEGEGHDHDHGENGHGENKQDSNISQASSKHSHEEPDSLQQNSEPEDEADSHTHEVHDHSKPSDSQLNVEPNSHEHSGHNHAQSKDLDLQPESNSKWSYWDSNRESDRMLISHGSAAPDYSQQYQAPPNYGQQYQAPPNYGQQYQPPPNYGQQYQARPNYGQQYQTAPNTQPYLEPNPHGHSAPSYVPDYSESGSHGHGGYQH